MSAPIVNAKPRIKSRTCIVLCVFGLILMFCSYRNMTFIDTYSGRIAHRTKVGFVTVHERVAETDFSDQLRAEKSPWGSHWQPVSESSPFYKAFSHYRYGYVPKALSLFVLRCHKRQLTETQTRALVLHAAELLRTRKIEELIQFLESQ